MSKDHWDAILASAPLNATAGRVTSKGEHFVSSTVVSERRWDAPPALAPVTRQLLRNASFENFSGRRIGRLTVLGMVAGEGSADNGAWWVCRCTCGNYVGRRAKGLRKALPDTCCQDCERTAVLRKAGSNARARAESGKARKW